MFVCEYCQISEVEQKIMKPWLKNKKMTMPFFLQNFLEKIKISGMNYSKKKVVPNNLINGMNFHRRF